MYRLSFTLVSLVAFAIAGQGQSLSHDDPADFTVSQGGNFSSILSWSSSNTSIKGFYVEKSVNGKDYFEIAFVENKSHAGIPETYGYIDENFSGSATYRLWEVTNSEIKSFQEANLNHSSTHNLEVYPNPIVSDHISLSGPNDIDFKLFLTDVNGAVVARSYGKLRALEKVVNNELPKMKNSVYFLKVESTHGSRTLRLVKK